MSVDSLVRPLLLSDLYGTPEWESLGIDGVRICVTGTLSIPRLDFLTAAVGLGARLARTAKDADVLIVGNLHKRRTPTTKQCEASEHGVRVLSEPAFIERYRRHTTEEPDLVLRSQPGC